MGVLHGQDQGQVRRHSSPRQRIRRRIPGCSPCPAVPGGDVRQEGVVEDQAAGEPHIGQHDMARNHNHGARCRRRRTSAGCHRPHDGVDPQQDFLMATRSAITPSTGLVTATRAVATAMARLQVELPVKVMPRRETDSPSASLKRKTKIRERWPPRQTWHTRSWPVIHAPGRITLRWGAERSLSCCLPPEEPDGQMGPATVLPTRVSPEHPPPVIGDQEYHQKKSHQENNARYHRSRPGKQRYGVSIYHCLDPP